MKIEFSKSLHFYSNHGAQIFVGRHRLPVAHSDIQVQLRVGHCPSCGIFSSAGLAETLYLGRGQCSCFNGKFLQLSYSIQVLLVTAVAGVIRLIVCSFIFLSVWRSSNMLFVEYQHFSNQRRSNPIQRCYAFPLLCNFTWAAFLCLLLWRLFFQDNVASRASAMARVLSLYRALESGPLRKQVPFFDCRILLLLRNPVIPAGQRSSHQLCWRALLESLFWFGCHGVSKSVQENVWRLLCLVNSF